MIKHIYVTTQFEGFHRWLSAPPCVEFLQDIHRHIFHVKVVISVYHNDRDIEFIQFKRYVDECIKLHVNRFDTGSCEDIADTLAKVIQYDYPGRSLVIIISEDDENGCICEY